MKRSHIAARLFGLPLLMLLLAGLLLPAGPAPVARAQTPALLPFLPVTIANTGPVMSSGPFFAALAVNGDWIGYTISNLGCGHCGTYVHTIVLRDTLDARQFTIHAATYRDFNANDVVFGARDIQFAGPYLLWRQPTRPANPSNVPSSRRGTSIARFACLICAPARPGRLRT